MTVERVVREDGAMTSVEEQDPVLHRGEDPIPNLAGLGGDICASFEGSYRATVTFEEAF